MLCCSVCENTYSTCVSYFANISIVIGPQAVELEVEENLNEVGLEGLCEKFIEVKITITLVLLVYVIRRG